MRFRLLTSEGRIGRKVLLTVYILAVTIRSNSLPDRGKTATLQPETP